MTYTIYQIMDVCNGVYVNCFRRDVDKATAKAAMERVKNFKNPTGRYVVIAADKEEAFFAKVNEIHVKRYEAWEKKQAIKAQRWELMEKAWVKGYKVTDAIGYLNGTKEEVSYFLNGR